jgi:hypothetical protein
VRAVAAFLLLKQEHSGRAKHFDASNHLRCVPGVGGTPVGGDARQLCAFLHLTGTLSSLLDSDGDTRGDASTVFAENIDCEICVALAKMHQASSGVFSTFGVFPAPQPSNFPLPLKWVNWDDAGN